MHWATRQNQMKMGQMGITAPFGQVMEYEAYYDPSEFGGRPNYGTQQNYGVGQPLMSNQPTYIIQDPYVDDGCCCCCCCYY